MWIMLINLAGHVPHGQRMDFLALFIGEQLYRLQVVRPTFRLLRILHFRAGQYQGNLFTLAIHLKLSIQSRTKRAGAPRPFGLVFS